VLEAEWHRAAGDLARARQYADEAFRHASAPRQPLALLGAHRMLGMLAAGARDISAAGRHFAQALALAHACRAPYERALTLIAHGELLVTTGAHQQARALLEDARSLCHSMDALPALAQIEQLSAQFGAPPDRLPGGLTPREAEVLRLVAAGMSNAEIADKLFISANTVKVHVASVLGKIDARNRAAATEYAIRNGIV
jgi:DNA-binding NarL/FixJ family response regulator